MTRINLMTRGAIILMATDAAVAAAATPAKPAPKKTVLDDMDARRIFATTEDAANYLNMCVNTFADIGTTPFAAPGLDMETGVFDPAIYVPGMAVMVAVLRKVGKAGESSTAKAIVVTPVPTLAYILSDDAGTAWADKIIQKELNHVAVRALRDAEDISTVVDQMPTTREAYISSAREGGSGIMETFNVLFKGISAVMGSKIAIWAKYKLAKADLKRALESKGFADEYFPALENRGEGKDSLFVTALNFGITAAKSKGLDPTIFERWLATRDAKAFDASKVEDDEDFDFGSMTESLLADDKPATAETAKDEQAAAVAEETPEVAPVAEVETDTKV